MSFIVIDGIRGSGKSTQLELLAEWLKKDNEVLVTDEPTQGPIGKLIREIVYNEEFGPKMDALLFTADRVWHVEQIIKPALEEGKFVLCDRYYYSTLAIQSNQGVDFNWIKELHKNILKPDLVIILDVPAEIGLERAKEKLTKDKFTKLEFLKKVRETYKLLVYRLKEEIFIVDGTEDKEKVHKKIKKIVKQVLEL